MTRISFASAAQIVGAIFLLAVGTLWSIDAGGVRGVLRENALDLELPYSDAAAAQPLVVVDIDSDALRRHGPWPWSRALLARLVDALSGAGPIVIGLDMLLDGDDRLSPASVARRLAAETGRADLAAIARELADGDAELERALALTPSVLGAVLSQEPTSPYRNAAPILARGALRLPDIWRAAAVIGPFPALAGAAAGIGLIVFENDPDGVARRTPLLAFAGGVLAPGFAVEALRVAREASTLIIEDAPMRLQIGDRAVALGPNASLRFRASPPDAWNRRTLSAADILDGGFDAGRIRNAIVLVGSSAPEVGILRRTAAAEAAPAVQIEADAITTLMSGAIATRPAILAPIETAGAALLGLFAIAAGSWLRPMRGLLVVAGLLACWIGLAAAFLRWGNLSLDPAGPPALAALLFTVSALAGAIRTERRERRLRGRFEQHLAPAIVARILASPDALRLEGETREVTAIFTDIEGFTAMSERAAPRDLIALLDAYFQMLADIIVEHGGMVDKIVGDAIHALFNAPLDLPDHPQRAVACAVALSKACAAFRSRPEARALGLGRTRIGLETGPVIIGDVGGKRKLDYTAHGMAINTAARLEAANKELGTTICIGPIAAARLAPGTARSVGRLKIRGRSEEIEVFEPEPNKC
ncbi:CHASE2 domain-containing protein [Methylocella silvestris]|nr:adenylate/guanylate cyclase domain-containing protein [Methylocella silvestris]